ncbi:MAG TPA: hypothetical protein PLQ89_13140 [Phycisphaerae bacterium]|nr:hypothetical protein [Phycisphaerae bacterium]HPP26588.1 hypothetical protein [Phycisphaerae bacterium]HPU25068.1 hypothetical protein [Phycisphaerae bacterium]
MSADSPGHFEDWGHALESLSAWQRAGQLDQHQAELLWLLQNRGNWRLREAGLEAMRTLKTPDPELLEEACRIVMDEGLYYQVRVLAAETLAQFAGDDPGSGGPGVPLAEEVRDRVHALLAAQPAPVLHQAFRRILPVKGK